MVVFSLQRECFRFMAPVHSFYEGRSFSFWGITSVQTYIYYQRFPNDRLLLKLIVSFSGDIGVSY